MKFQMKCLSWMAWLSLVGMGSASLVSGAELSGSVRVDGSSTVFPISAAVAEEFNRVKGNEDVRVTVAYSGTGGGFKKWCLGETDINDASRPIKDKEKKCATEHGISYLELPVAYDGITLVISQNNDFLESITMAELKKLWEPGSKIKTWNQVRKGWPKEEVKLYGPGPDSGTFDYFTEEVMGKSRESRSDYTASEDDNVLVKGVSASPYALGYFGYAYYIENKNKLKAVKLDKGKGPVAPEDKTIEDGSYPLSRPIFIYVSSKSAAKPQVKAFIDYYLDHAADLSKQVGYTPLAADKYKSSKEKFAEFVKAGKKAE